MRWPRRRTKMTKTTVWFRFPTYSFWSNVPTESSVSMWKISFALSEDRTEEHPFWITPRWQDYVFFSDGTLVSFSVSAMKIVLWKIFRQVERKQRSRKIEKISTSEPTFMAQCDDSWSEIHFCWYDNDTVLGESGRKNNLKSYSEVKYERANLLFSIVVLFHRHSESKVHWSNRLLSLFFSFPLLLTRHISLEHHLPNGFDVTLNRRMDRFARRWRECAAKSGRFFLQHVRCETHSHWLFRFSLVLLPVLWLGSQRTENDSSLVRKEGKGKEQKKHSDADRK